MNPAHAPTHLYDVVLCVVGGRGGQVKHTSLLSICCLGCMHFLQVSPRCGKRCITHMKKNLTENQPKKKQVKHTSFPFNKLPRIYAFLASNPKMWGALYCSTKAAAGTMLGVEEVGGRERERERERREREIRKKKRGEREV